MQILELEKLELLSEVIARDLEKHREQKATKADAGYSYFSGSVSISCL